MTMDALSLLLAIFGMITFVPGFGLMGEKKKLAWFLIVVAVLLFAAALIINYHLHPEYWKGG